MAVHLTWRRHAAVAAVVALGTLTLIACGRHQAAAPGGSGDGPTGDAHLGAAAITSGPTADSAGGNATAGSSGGGDTTQPAPPPVPSYPDTARSYAEALLAAWMHKDYTRLDQLAVTAAVQQIKDSVTSGGLPDPHWHYISCQGAAGSSYCRFSNDDGDETTIRMANSQIGHPAAVQEAPLDRTEFAGTPGTYVSAFINAWQHDNRRRMLVYSSQDVVDFATHHTRPVAFSLCPPGNTAGSTYIEVKGSGTGGTTFYYTFQVTNEVLSAPDRAHAIASARIAAAPC